MRSGSAAERDGKDRGGRGGHPQPLDAGQTRRGIAPDVDDDELGGSAVTNGVDNAHRDGAGTQKAADVFLERVVRRDNQTCDMGHVTPAAYLTSRIACANELVVSDGLSMTSALIGCTRAISSLPFMPMTNTPRKLTILKSALRPVCFPFS